MLQFTRSAYIAICLFFAVTGMVMAQDTIALHGQPDWKKGFNIADKSFFYQDDADYPLTFDEITKQTFVPFKKELRALRYTNRPLVVQWHKFILKNTSPTDSLILHLYLSPHMFTRLYANHQLIAVGGAYETRQSYFNLGEMLCVVAPGCTVTYWARTEDRQNQMVAPDIALQTPFTFAKTVANVQYTNRYLFLLLAILAGCLFFITVYALCQYFLYRDNAVIWYTAYTTASFFIALFWIDIRIGLRMFSALFHDLALSGFLFLVPILYAFFIGSILQLPLYLKSGWAVVKILVVIIGCQMLIEFVVARTGWFMFNYNYYGYVVSIIPMVLLHFVLLVLTALSKNAVKWFLFSGLVSLLLLWCLPLTNVFYLIPSKSQEVFVITIFVPAFLLLGITIEAICFSLALSYRSKLVLVEKNTMQLRYAKDLEETLAERTAELEDQRNVREEQKLLQVAIEFENKIAQTEMTALRAQMNPHFIFNCLNSIKLYTLQNDSKTASEYLTIFSQLIRLVLENSQSEKVTLQKELETLRLYIELEAMRFKSKVQYQINVAPGIDQQFIGIPPLLLQPYVENAIWHGLMHKNEGGSIIIDVHQPAENLLNIQITDDGVGRALAAEYKSKSATRQKSYGLQMRSERIKIINQLYQMHADVEIIDLLDGRGFGTGTKVCIQIPI